MKVALMQPYFFPYLGYFQLIRAVDRFILFDDVQYIQRGWINRNRILKPVEGSQYIQLPIAKHGSRTPIKEIQTIAGYNWKSKILRQLEHYRTKAPFYPQVHRVLTDCFALDHLGVAQLNSSYLRLICNYLGVRFEIEMSSGMNFDYSGISGPGDWGLSVSEQIGASEYINPAGGAAFFDGVKFARHGIKLSLLTPDLKQYNQRRKTYEPAMSIIDVLMFNGPESVKAMLNNFALDSTA